MRIGRGSFVHPRSQIIGRANVSIGENSCISANCWLNVNDRSPGREGISIGSNCFIGRDNFFSSGRSIRLRDYCLTTIGCRFICSTHGTADPRIPYAASGITATDSILIGPNSFFGAGALVLGNVTIGHGCVIGAHSLVSSDVPPFSVVVGNPGRVVRRYSFSEGAWLPIERLTAASLSGNPDEEEYVAALRIAVPRIPISWFAAGADFGDL
jgi:acetyltransferase-like isoleucine patch superfamily enzyme